MVAGGIGIVLASFGRSVLVQASEGLVRCGLKGRKLRVVCGDRVVWGYPPSADGPSVESRRAAPQSDRANRCARARRAGGGQYRQTGHRRGPQPEPDWFLVDRYWAGAALKDLDALIIVNKKDLGTGAIEAQLDEYRRLNLRCIEVSCQSGEGIAELAQALSGQCELAGRPVRGRKIIAGERACPGSRSADRRVDARCRGTAYHHHGALVPARRRPPPSSMRPACATLPRPRTWCVPRNAALSKYMRAARNADSRIAGTWRSPAARCAAP